jgi:phosphatidylserine synthase
LPDRSVSALKVTEKLFIDHNIYIKHCAGKTMPESDRYLRIASRTQPENLRLVAALQDVIGLEKQNMTGTNLSDPPPSILSFAKDLPNICSLAGLLCAVLAIYYAILGIFPAAMIGLIWAVFFDWTDGIIARKLKGRNEKQREFGGQLDSLIDIISFGICPAVVLLSYVDFSPWFLPGAFLIVAAGVLRLSYFNIFGLVGESTYMGRAMDNNGIILPFVFLFIGIFDQALGAVALYIILLAVAALNVAPIKTPKLTGRLYYVLTLYTLIVTVIYGRQLFTIQAG